MNVKNYFRRHWNVRSKDTYESGIRGMTKFRDKFLRFICRIFLILRIHYVTSSSINSTMSNLNPNKLNIFFFSQYPSQSWHYFQTTCKYSCILATPQEWRNVIWSVFEKQEKSNSYIYLKRTATTVIDIVMYSNYSSAYA